MKKGLTEMVFILDKSGSMGGLESDTVGGYNSLIAKQKEEDGDAIVTTVLFDSKYIMICDGERIENVPPMKRTEFFACGCTALLDAVGKTINHVVNRRLGQPKKKIPSRTIVAIMTDGYENASREFPLERVKQMIENQKRRHDWEFLFLGANIDAVQTAETLGIVRQRAVNFVPDEIGIKTNFDALSRTIKSFSMYDRISNDWSEEIHNYYNKK